MTDLAFRRESARQWVCDIVPHTSLSSVQKRNVRVLFDWLEEALQERDSFSLKYSQIVHDLSEMEGRCRFCLYEADGLRDLANHLEGCSGRLAYCLPEDLSQDEYDRRMAGVPDE